MVIFDVLIQVFSQLANAILVIPLNNGLAVLYVIANFFLQLFGASLEG